MINIDGMVEGYWSCAMWSSSCNGTVKDHEGCRGEDCDTSLSELLGREDVGAETWSKIHEDCVNFLTLVTTELERDHPLVLVELDAWGDEEFGHDLWLTRNGHGTGFWDRGQGELGNMLTNWAHAAGSAYLTVGDDGRIYHD